MIEFKSFWGNISDDISKISEPVVMTQNISVVLPSALKYKPNVPEQCFLGSQDHMER